jgi:methylmalonyl-CoA mutase N-terminal domain/subunit
VAHESGIANTADPLAGSYYVERLTDELEQRAESLIAKVDELGGAARAIEAGFLHEEIARSAYAHQLRVESGELTIVGVNRFADDSREPAISRPDYTRLEAEQIDRLRRAREQRNAAAVRQALESLRNVAVTYREDAADRRSLMPLIVDAVRARATVGEISDQLRDAWGSYSP